MTADLEPMSARLILELRDQLGEARDFIAALLAQDTNLADYAVQVRKLARAFLAQTEEAS